MVTDWKPSAQNLKAVQVLYTRVESLLSVSTDNATMSLKRVLSHSIAAFILAASSAVIADDWLHSVRPGDTIWDLCLELTEEPNCWQKLPRLNPHVVNMRQMPPGATIKIPVEWLKNPPVPAEVEYVQGQAVLFRSDTNQASELTAGDKLHMGDRIATTNGTVLLRFADGSTFLLKTESEVTLERLSAHGETGMVDTHIKLQHGTGRAKVQKRNGKTRYKISTPTAIATARGTEYSVSADGNAVSRSEVLEGTVGVASKDQKGAQSVAQGFGTRVEKGKAVEAPRKLLPAVDIALGADTEIPFTLQWSAINGAVSYSVDVFKGEGAGRLLKTLNTQQNKLDFLKLEDDHYRFAIRAIDEIGLRGIEASANTKAATVLRAPVLTSDNIKLSDNGTALTWPAIEHASGYQLEISDNANFSNLLVNEQLDTAAYDGTLPEQGVYYARLKTLYTENRSSAFSETIVLNNQSHSWWWIGMQTLAVLAVILL